MERLLIIGSGIAAAQLLKDLHEFKHEFQIELIGEEPLACYNRILLSSILSGEKSHADLSLIDDHWYQANNIEVHSDEKVHSVDLQKKFVITSRRRQVYFDRLVFASGSVPYWPDIPGINASQVMAFRTREDLEKIITTARQSKHPKAVVIGGGLLGLEAASGLNLLGVEVTVLNRGEWLMQRQLDGMAGQVLQKSLEEKGIHFRLGVSPERILEEAGHVKALETDAHEILPCNMVIVAAGILPNVTLARDAGIQCKRGIEVNGLMQTRHACVYALGECCEIQNKLFGLVAPVRQQARILAASLSGNKTEVFKYKETPVQLKISGINVVSAGILPDSETAESQLVIDSRRNIYRRLIFKNNSLVGFILVGDKQHAAWYMQIMEGGMPVHKIRSTMMFGMARVA